MRSSPLTRREFLQSTTVAGAAAALAPASLGLSWGQSASGKPREQTEFPPLEHVETYAAGLQTHSSQRKTIRPTSTSPSGSITSSARGPMEYASAVGRLCRTTILREVPISITVVCGLATAMCWASLSPAVVLSACPCSCVLIPTLPMTTPNPRTPTGSRSTLRAIPRRRLVVTAGDVGHVRIRPLQLRVHDGRSSGDHVALSRRRYFSQSMGRVRRFATASTVAKISKSAATGHRSSSRNRSHQDPGRRAYLVTGGRRNSSACSIAGTLRFAPLIRKQA